MKRATYVTILLSVIFGVSLPAVLWADSPYLGTLSALDVMVTLVFALCHVAGIVFIFLSLVYYRRYRQNPNETPLSRVLWTLILGVIIFFIPALAEYNQIYSTLQEASDEAPLVNTTSS